ncbi:DUF4350 domain-containing protein [Pseudoxanthomonas wuyuanensis]
MSRATRWLRVVGIVLLVVAIVAAGVLWFLHRYQRVDQVIHLPPRGEAGYNPLYALKQTLLADDVAVQSRQRLNLASHALTPADTLLIFNDPRSMTPPEARRLLQWVDRGGHLLVRTPGLAGWGDDAYSPLLAQLDIVPMSGSRQCEPFQVEGEDHHVEFCRGQRFRLDGVEPELAWGDLKSGYVYARLAHGQGHVDVLADFDFLINSEAGGGVFADGGLDAPKGGLRDGPHRALARQVLSPNYGKGTMHLVYDAQMPSLLRMILVQGWMVWLPLTLALLAWLWSRMQRFGPQLPAPAGERRSLLEHVRASGEHLFRYGRGVMLYAAVRQAFLMRLRRRDPVAAALSGEPQIAAIAQRLSLPADSVRSALQTPSSHDKAAFRDRISTLVQLRNRL